MSIEILGEDFYKFAQHDAAKWLLANGASVKHSSLGLGLISSVTDRKNYLPLISIQFADKAIDFNSDAFKAGVFKSIFIDENIFKSIKDELKEIELKEKEIAQDKVISNHLKEIARNFKISRDVSPTSFLAVILLKDDSNSYLSSEEIQWMEHEGHFYFLGKYFSKKYIKSLDGWDIAKSSKYFRKSKHPEMCLEITSEVRHSSDLEPRLKAALLTTRGAAFRDIGDIDNAMKAAEDAIIASSNDPHAYNLKGALLYEKQDFLEGDKFFDKAISLGSSHSTRTNQLRSTLERSGNENRRLILEHLKITHPKLYEQLMCQ